MTRLETLNEKLKEAIRNENFEKAKEIKDELEYLSKHNDKFPSVEIIQKYTVNVSMDFEIFNDGNIYVEFKTDRDFDRDLFALGSSIVENQTLTNKLKSSNKHEDYLLFKKVANRIFDLTDFIYNKWLKINVKLPYVKMSEEITFKDIRILFKQWIKNKIKRILWTKKKK